MRARTIRTLTFGVSAMLALGSTATDVRAQGAGVAKKALPNVLLLVDTSGSMERMIDNTLPNDNVAPALPLQNTCLPGTASNPNRWGILLQALTGNLQPYSCAAMNRATVGPANMLVNEYRIAGVKPYDADYFLPYHRPLSGATLPNACAMGPNKLPGGAGIGVGPFNQSSATDPLQADAFPADALRNLLWTDILASYPGPFPGGSTIPAANTCDFLQADDGQLDASRDYIRFSLMTFDQDLDPGIGVTNTNVPSGTVLPAAPFLGQWSYLPAAPMAGYGGPSGKGKPAGCPTLTDFEVGARNWAAPPWEGRLVRFPDPLGTLGDIERTNEQIQNVLLSSRPYGATPIDAMLADAKDYLLVHPKGPKQTDPYLKNATTCRDQYNILLTDGAPNLAMRTSCEPPGQCPYQGALPVGTKQSIAWDIANQMFLATPSIKTFVIGFAVNGTSTTIPNDGFPIGVTTKTCSFWFANPAASPNGFNKSSSSMSTYCRATPPTVGSTADACCQLNELAYYGSGGSAPPYFADSQQSLINAFGQVLAQVTQTASTRTVPAFSSTASVAGATNYAASFNAAFVPNARKPWSGELVRTLDKCVNTTGTLTLGAPLIAQGDYFEENLKTQSSANQRLFITAIGTTTGTGADSFRTMRPFAGVYPDGVPAYGATERGGMAMDLILLAKMTAPDMGIDATTCKKTRDSTGLVQVPALIPSDCSKAIWNFASASPASEVLGVSTPAGYDFNVRCKAGGNKCALTGAGCVLDSDCDPPNKGDVCVPACAALGAIFRSSPATSAPPNSLNRDEGYRQFADLRATRTPALFVATTDGLLHAFKALTVGPPTSKHELWNFVPPAVLPRLASNYPGGQQILLDGSPVVKDAVWDRDRTQLSEARQWHTTLVAGMGSNGPGYYALNVSDVGCGAGNLCNDTTYQEPPVGSLAGASVAGNAGDASANHDYATSKVGPHFLWQLTDVERTTEPLSREVRKAKPPLGDNKSFVALFGKSTGTPAIATLLFSPTPGVAREIGVAILPGGIDAPPDKTGTCPRVLGSGPYSAAAFPDLSDPAAQFAARTIVHQWGTSPCSGGTPFGSPVAGRSLTIVRLDTGEIIRHFGRTLDTPASIQGGGHFTDSPFDSPITGVPIPFPSDVGAVATKIFVGDADGTMWRLDVSSTDPAQWHVNLFQDLFRPGVPLGLEGQPISVPPIASLDPVGNVLLSVATGEQENLVASTVTNKVFSIVEGRPDVSGNLHAQVQWFLPLANGERVTGPMAVFDGTHYFATYQPEQDVGGGVCAQKANVYVYGLDYYRPKNPASLNLGGDFKYPPTPFTQRFDFSAATVNTLIPGVAVKQSLACATQSGVATTDFFGMANYGVSQQQPSTFSLAIPVAKGAAGVPTPPLSVTLPNPRTPTTIDSWALVVD